MPTHIVSRKQRFEPPDSLPSVKLAALWAACHWPPNLDQNMWIAEPNQNVTQPDPSMNHAEFSAPPFSGHAHQGTIELH
jgi:hypothetical protein